MESIVNDHIFIWLSHGTVISPTQVYYPIKSEFKRLLCPGNFGEGLYLDKYLDIINGNSCFDTESKLPFETENNISYMPPLCFAIKESDKFHIVEAGRVTDFFGLFYCRFESIMENGVRTQCINKTLEPLISWEDIYNDVQHQFFTYSYIIQRAQYFAKAKGINSNTIDLMIVSCLSLYETYTSKYEGYDLTIGPVKGSIMPNIPLRDIESFRNINREMFDNNVPFNEPGSIITLSLISIDTEDIIKKGTSWVLLPRNTVPGCGFDVLSFLKLIPDNEAREMSVCMSPNGTSIFAICHYIFNHYVSNVLNNFSDDKTYLNVIAVRFQLKNVISVLLGLKDAGNGNNFALIIKFYREKYIGGTHDYNHEGHIMSIVCISNTLIMCDPQVAIYETFSDEVTLLGILDKYGYTKESYLDIMFTVLAKNQDTRYTYEKLRYMYGFLPEPSNIYDYQVHNNQTLFGGDVLRHQDLGYEYGGTKTRFKLLSKPNTKKKINNKFNKNFSKIMREIDKKMGIKSALTNGNAIKIKLPVLKNKFVDKKSIKKLNKTTRIKSSFENKNQINKDVRNSTRRYITKTSHTKLKLPSSTRNYVTTIL